MNIENTKFIVEVSDYDEVNEYIQLGWLLVNQYVQNFGELGQPSQRIFYILAWQKPDEEPLHPQDSSFLRRQREAEQFKRMLDSQKIV